MSLCSEKYGGPGDGIFMPSDKTFKKHFFPNFINYFIIMSLLNLCFNSSSSVQDIWIYLLNWTNMSYGHKQNSTYISFPVFKHCPITSDSKLLFIILFR